MIAPTTEQFGVSDTPAGATTTAAQAFAHLRPLRDAYAMLPIQEGFNWTECLSAIEEGQWYLVVFRSVRTATADAERLTEFDDRAYDEALAGLGLLHYFRGALSERRECLSLCVWESQDQARQASRLPLHQAAQRLAAEMYEWFALERYQLIKCPGSPVPLMLPVLA